MSDLERNGHYLRPLFIANSPLGSKEIFGDKIELIHKNLGTILGERVISPAHKYDISFAVFLYYKPGAATKAQAFALPDSVEPKALMCTQRFARFVLNNTAGSLA